MPLSEPTSQPLKTLFVGGPGRSGTSFVADRLGRHPDICTFPDIELKIFTEKNGLIDLHHALVETFSPNRATVALDQFRRFALALVDGRHGQPALTTFARREDWANLIESFLATLCTHGQASPMRSEVFHIAARQLLRRTSNIAAKLKMKAGPPPQFLEKTPHSLLALDFLARLSPGCGFLHVMRDPRSVAFSLRSVGWGPSELSACCRWVANYCEAWMTMQARAAHLGLSVTKLNIEAIATAPARHSEQVCTDFNLSHHADLFQNASLATLNGWTKKCTQAEMAELNAFLRGWAELFGYLDSEVGVLRNSQPDYAA